MDSRQRVTLQEAADLANVHYMTAYRYVRTGRLPARQEGSRWTVATSDLVALQQGGRRQRGAGRSANRAQLMDRLVAGDEPGAWAVVNAALTSGMRAGEVLLGLVAGALRTIGERWATGELSVADEHRASSVASRIIGRLGPMFARRGRKRGTIVVGTAAGDMHVLPGILCAIGQQPGSAGRRPCRCHDQRPPKGTRGRGRCHPGHSPGHSHPGGRRGGGGRAGRLPPWCGRLVRTRCRRGRRGAGSLAPLSPPPLEGP
jgi:excisionase family DNA binding protein